MKTLTHLAFTVSCLLALLSSYAIAQTGKMTTVDVSPVTITDGTVELTPETTMIEFVGTHVGSDPKPRVGGFRKFEGQVVLTGENTAIQSLSLEIDINSVWTEFAELTKHLKNADFFESDKFSSSKFKSTKIGKDDKGETTITGDLTLHGQTREITFPAKVRFRDNGLMMKCEFELDRALFGMNKMISGVEKLVSLQMIVGQKPKTRNAMSGPKNNKKDHGTTKNRNVKEPARPVSHSVSISVPNMT